MEKSRAADDQVDQMSQALNRLLAMVSLPKYSPPMPRPPSGERGMDGVIGWSRSRAVAGGAAGGRPTLSRFFPLERGFGPRLRGADMADLPGGASGLRVRGYKGKEADRLVTHIDPGVVSLVAELRGHERQAAEDWASGRPGSKSNPRRIAGGGHPGDDLLPGSRSRRWSGGRWRCNWSRRPRHERRMDYRRRSALI
jgi:hypothetical protein